MKAQRLVALLVSVVVLSTSACVPEAPPLDAVAPVLSLPGPIFLAATSPSGAAVAYAATATDAVDGAVPVTCTPASGSLFSVGAAPVTCSASDAAGNVAAGQFTVTVAPWIPPTTGAVAIGAGNAHTCALLGDDTASCWGQNTSGPLGNGTNTNSNVPVPVSALTGAVAVAASTYGRHNCA
ncbi:MAG: HYR domain-containing protein, partial [Microthrixaceae bacterium]